MPSNVGPGALLKLIGGALRLDAETFRNAALDLGVSRLCFAVAVVAALSNGFAYASEGVAKGILGENDVVVYRLLVIVGVAEVIVHYLLFTFAVWLVRLLVERRRPSFGRLARPIAVALAPSCLLVLGPLLGYPELVRGALALWRLAACVVVVRVATDASWAGAAVTVLVADLAAAPLVDLALFGVAGEGPLLGPSLPA